MEQGKDPQLLLTSQKERQTLIFLMIEKKIQTKSDQVSTSHNQFVTKLGDNVLAL